MFTNTKKMNQENNRREELLTKENNDYMIDIVWHLRMQNIEDSKIEEIRRDILDMMLEGQQRGVSAKEIFSENYEVLCEELLEIAPKKSKKTLLIEFFSIICTVLVVLSFYDLLSEGLLQFLKISLQKKQYL